MTDIWLFKLNEKYFKTNGAATSEVLRRPHWLSDKRNASCSSLSPTFEPTKGLVFSPPATFVIAIALLRGESML
jgi:hypothetical protein